jgi:hypothetical protein
MSLKCNNMRDNKGGVFILIAVLLPTLMIILGVAVETGQIYAVRAKAQHALDAGLLGAISTANSNPNNALSTEETQNVLESVAVETRRLFNAAYPEKYMGTNVTDQDIVVNSTRANNFEASLTVKMPNIFSGFVGDEVHNISIISKAVHGYNCTDFDSVCPNLELALVLDNTGSMSETMGGGTTRMDALKTASKDLVDILFGDEETLKNLHISVVPYDMVVQIGTGRAGWMQDVPLQPYQTIPQVTSKGKYERLVAKNNKGFAANRETLADINLRKFTCGTFYTLCDPNAIQSTWVCPPDGQHLTGYTYVGEDAFPVYEPCVPGSVHNVNFTCASLRGTDNVIYPVTLNDFSCLDNGLNDVDDTPPTQGEQYKFRLPNENANLDGNTNSGPGDPNWQKWNGFLAPMKFAMNDKAQVKAALDSMTLAGYTDISVGLMWGWFTLSEKWTGLWDAGKPNAPFKSGGKNIKQMVLMTDGWNNVGNYETVDALCTKIKAQNITIYTIGLGAPGGYNKDSLIQCASQPTYFFAAPSAEDLRLAFRRISDNILQVTTHLTQ